MLVDIVEVRPVGTHRLWLRFEDGVAGEIDIARLISFQGIFAALRAPDFFDQVSVNREIGTICWPNGADLDPDTLYALVSGQPLPAFQDLDSGLR